MFSAASSYPLFRSTRHIFLDPRYKTLLVGTHRNQVKSIGNIRAKCSSFSRLSNRAQLQSRLTALRPWSLVRPLVSPGRWRRGWTLGRWRRPPLSATPPLRPPARRSCPSCCRRSVRATRGATEAVCECSRGFAFIHGNQVQGRERSVW